MLSMRRSRAKGPVGSVGEGQGGGAEFGFGVEEDGLVDEIVAEEGSIDPRAGFDEQAEDAGGVEVAENLVQVQRRAWFSSCLL